MSFRINGTSITSRSDEKLQHAIKLGADEGLNTSVHPDWGKRVKQIAGGDEVDLIVEVGGEQTLPHSLRAVRSGGTISMIGVLSGPVMNVGLGLIVTRHVRLQGITVGSRDDFEAMARGPSRCTGCVRSSIACSPSMS